MTESAAQAVGGNDAPPRGKRFDTTFGFTLDVQPGDYSSELILRDGVFEIPETDLVTRLLRPGDVCIDGGCHIGYYSCLMAKLTGPTGRVYAFDANPWCCERTKLNLRLNGMSWSEVVHAALGDAHGTTSFHIASDDQTGLSSLGRIERPKNIIPAPWLRLEDFLNERSIQRVRLLKLDVEGAEKICLTGLGKVLTEHRIDYVLLECYDERLRLLQCSTRDVADILVRAGYVPWEYGTKHPSGWSRAEAVASRGDCNYLFASPTVPEHIASITLANALSGKEGKVAEQQRTLDELEQALEEQRDHITRLSNTLQEGDAERLRLRTELEQVSATLQAVIGSKGWRLLRFLRNVRNVVMFRPREGR